MASLYWIEASLPGLLPSIWMVVGVGLPWALAALSTRQWQSRAMVGALALALGPAWMTAWMLLLGVIGAQLDMRLLTAEWILTGSAVIACAGVAVAWRKRRHSVAVRGQPLSLEFDEKLIVAMIVFAVVLRWIHTAYFPFTVYDALWVYGYQGRLYFLEGNIPDIIGYYPQFVPLQFAYVQVMIGEINDHAARMVLPMMHIGSILAAYLLGQRLVNRRVGLFTAALWSLHPYVGQWAFRGDLEIPLTFSFTMAALFFLCAWRKVDDVNEGRAHAILAGVMLGIALFTKPTAGAFAWGVGLLVVVELLRSRLDAGRWLPRFKLALWTGLACLPLGVVWYLRNILLGHDAVTLPKAIWLTRALRNGDYLAPLVVALLVCFLAVILRQRLKVRDLILGSVGGVLVLASALASNSALSPARVDPPASYLRLEEVLGIVAGFTLVAYSLRDLIKRPFSPQAARMLETACCALLLALPYFVTFYFSYSYHYRLGFATVPLLCLPSAIALSLILDRDRMRRWSKALRRAYYMLLLLAGLPGIVAVATDVNWTSVWLLRNDLDSDFKKYQVFNPSLMQVVLGLEDYMRESVGRPVVVAPGEERLPFFFPQIEIIDAELNTLDEVETLGATHLIYGAKAREAYLETGVDPVETQLVAALGRYDLFKKVKSHYDGIFSYELYELSDLSRRKSLNERFTTRQESQNRGSFGNLLQVYSAGVYPEMIHKTTPMTLDLTWRALEKLESDYQFVLQLLKATGGDVVQEWKLKPAAHRHGHYSTLLWDVGEVVNDRHVLYLDEETERKRDTSYVFKLSVWDPREERYLPHEAEGEPAGEYFQLPGIHRLRS